MGGAADAARKPLGRPRKSVSDCEEPSRDEVKRVCIIEDVIRERPLKAVLVAAGIGVLVGRFWMRR